MQFTSVVCRPFLVVILFWNALLGTSHLLRGRTEQDNLCIWGKGAPQVYLLGAQKSGTTSMYEDFMRVGLATASHKKEMHAFNWVCGFHKLGKQPFRELVGAHHSGSCPQTVNADVRMSLARRLIHQCGWRGLFDASPDSLRIPGLPKMLSSLYGIYSKSLVFVVLLREPMSRTHSSYYEQIEVSRKYEYVHFSFQDYINDVKKSGALLEYRKAGWKGAENDYLIDIIYRSMYFLQFQHWLDPALFKASQFTVAPMGKYFGSAEMTRGMLARIGSRLNMQLRLDAVHRTTERHVSHYMPLQYDLDAESRKWLNEFFAEDTQQLCELFARHHPDGLDLYEYKGASNADEIRAYLTENW